MVSELVVAPELLPPLTKLVPFLRHWKARKEPVAPTVNVREDPTPFVASTGVGLLVTVGLRYSERVALPAMPPMHPDVVLLATTV